MKVNLKSREKVIEGQTFILPPDVSWRNAANKSGFIVQYYENGERPVKFFGLKKHLTLAVAHEAACAFAKEKREARGKLPPYAILGFDRHGKPLALGKGIYLQTNASRGNYQLFSVIYGSKLKGNYRRGSVSIGRAGYFTKATWRARLKEAQALRAKWVAEDRQKSAANNPDFQQAA